MIRDRLESVSGLMSPKESVLGVMFPKEMLRKLLAKDVLVRESRRKERINRRDIRKDISSINKRGISKTSVGEEVLVTEASAREVSVINAG